MLKWNLRCKKDFSCDTCIEYSNLGLFILQSEALAFCGICRFFCLPSWICGFIGARRADEQGPFCLDWCCWRSAMCCCVDKVCLQFPSTTPIIFHSLIHLSSLCTDFPSPLQRAGVLDMPLRRLKGVMSCAGLQGWSWSQSCEENYFWQHMSLCDGNVVHCSLLNGMTRRFICAYLTVLKNDAS